MESPSGRAGRRGLLLRSLPSTIDVSVPATETSQAKDGWLPFHVKVGPATLVGPLGPPVIVGGPGTVESIRKARDWLVPPPPFPALSRVRMYQRSSVSWGNGWDQTPGSRVAEYWVDAGDVALRATTRYVPPIRTWTS